MAEPGLYDLQATRVLLVDDDPVVLKLYQEGLSQRGLQVVTAADGLAAVKALRTYKPDVVVLDLMMPKFSGVDVLKFIRSEEAFKELPVVVLANSYMNDLAAQTAALGVQKALLKVRCGPSFLSAAIKDVLAGKSGDAETSHLLGVPVRRPSAAPPPVPSQSPAPPAAATQPDAAESRAKAHRDLLEGAHSTCTSLHNLCQAFGKATTAPERDNQLQALYRKVHLLAGAAGLAECHRLAQMATAFEALLFELTLKPKAATPSVLRTIASTVDFLALLFRHTRDKEPETPLSARALVVDDDPLSNKLVVSALQRAQFDAHCVEDPIVGLQCLETHHFDLVLLDIEMPAMDGFELCVRLRKLPGYEKTPVIYITVHTDFESRAKSRLSGGSDFIAKPVFPMELAVKAVTMLMKGQLQRA